MKLILVLGYIVRGPLGGLVFHHLQYVLGLKKLGYKVLFLEDSENYPACYDPGRHQLTEDPAYGLKFLANVFKRYNLENDWAYYDYHQNRWYGKSSIEVHNFCEDTDLLLNLSGSNPIRSWTEKVPLKIYVDTDPVFTQINNLQKPDFRERTAQHTHHFTFGENIGAKDCVIPDDGFFWQPTRQPVVPDIWPQIPIPAKSPLSTVMQWDSYATLSHKGRQYGMKSASFDPYFSLPRQVESSLCLAVGSANVPTEQLKGSGWSLQNAQKITLTPDRYQQFIYESRGEWSVAKQGYVSARSGWFSERSCAYLASARPVVVQDTGFSKWLPTGKAIFPFSDPEESIEAIRKVAAHKTNFRAACREVISEFFDYRSVLPWITDLGLY